MKVENSPGSGRLDDGQDDSWLSSARLVSPVRLAALLDEHRSYLKRIAEAELPERLQARLDSSDLVQETLLLAYRQFGQFAGSTDAQFVGWLREILRNQIIDATRHHGRQVRDVSRNQPLPDAVACDRTLSASEVARRTETGEQLRDALAKLPEHYRTVILLRQEQDLSFEEIGQHMDRTADAARMLWGRAILQLSKLMQPDG
ncbi:MAG: sigma-70 family RNA polymerase sigma factor [Planctomycetales bacterium]|nr:sigma-70 family RNA polymerase sigma factor [Planctomycetales bacterium]